MIPYSNNELTKLHVLAIDFCSLSWHSLYWVGTELRILEGKYNREISKEDLEITIWKNVIKENKIEELIAAMKGY